MYPFILMGGGFYFMNALLSFLILVSKLFVLFVIVIVWLRLCFMVLTCFSWFLLCLTVLSGIIIVAFYYDVFYLENI